MKKCLPFIFLLLSLSIFGAKSEELQFRGQEGDSFNLELTKSLTQYRTEYRDSTCTRQIPYTAQECGNETRYREECHWQSGRNICRTEYERQCRTVTRHRRECTRRPSRRTCRNSEPQRICRNGRCWTEPSRRICTSQPGREVCRQVPYQERDCSKVPRRVCDWSPGRNICNQVSYQDWVCHDVTRYRSETYSCQRPIQIPYTVEKEVRSEVLVSYQDNTNQARANLSFTLLNDGSVALKAIDRSDSQTLIQVEKDEDHHDQDGNIESKSHFRIKFISQDHILSPIKNGISSVGLSQTALWFNLGKIYRPKKLEIKVTIVRDGLFSSAKVLFNKILRADELKVAHGQNSSKVFIDLSKYGVNLKRKKHEITIEAKALVGADIVNPPRGDLSTSRKITLKAQ